MFDEFLRLKALRRLYYRTGPRKPVPKYYNNGTLNFFNKPYGTARHLVVRLGTILINDYNHKNDFMES